MTRLRQGTSAEREQYYYDEFEIQQILAGPREARRPDRTDRSRPRKSAVESGKELADTYPDYWGEDDDL